MSTQPTRAEVMASIWTQDYPELAALDSVQHLDALRSWVRSHTNDGTLDSRHNMHELIHRLVCWMVHDLDLTDQELFEHLESIIPATTDQYRQWSPEWEFPVSNAEAVWLMSHDSWDDLVTVLLTDPDPNFAVGNYTPSTPPTALTLVRPGSPNQALTKSMWEALKARG